MCVALLWRSRLALGSHQRPLPRHNSNNAFSDPKSSHQRSLLSGFLPSVTPVYLSKRVAKKPLSDEKRKCGISQNPVRLSPQTLALLRVIGTQMAGVVGVLAWGACPVESLHFSVEKKLMVAHGKKNTTKGSKYQPLKSQTRLLASPLQGTFWGGSYLFRSTNTSIYASW